MRAAPYLYFRGNCEGALAFYAACGLGRIETLTRYADSALAARYGLEWHGKVLHAVFEGASLRICASDGPDSEPMKGCALFLEFEHVETGRAMFELLAAGGRVTVPYERQPWGDHYGNFTDRFGVQWAILGSPQ